MNYVLIGMPGSGKSTMGVLLAKYIGFGFVDCDLMIQSREKKLLSEIIESEGVERFIEIENEVISCLWVDRCIIATGGSAVYGEEAMQHFREIGAIIYLQVDYEVIRKRLHNIKRRGVVLREGQTLSDLYDERCALYEKYADMIVREAGGEIEDVVAEIICRIRENQPRKDPGSEGQPAPESGA